VAGDPVNAAGLSGPAAFEEGTYWVRKAASYGEEAERLSGIDPPADYFVAHDLSGMCAQVAQAYAALAHAAATGVLLAPTGGPPSEEQAADRRKWLEVTAL
jgi:hypothetical protein